MRKFNNDTSKLIDKLIALGADLKPLYDYNKYYSGSLFLCIFMEYYYKITLKNYKIVFKIADKFPITSADINNQYHRHILFHILKRYEKHNNHLLIIIAKYLISKGADYNIRDNNKKSFKDHCIELKIWNEVIKE